MTGKPKLAGTVTGRLKFRDWPESVRIERPKVSMEEFRTMVEGDWNFLEDRIRQQEAQQRVRKEELEFMRGQDARLTDLFNQHGSMTHQAEAQIHKDNPMLAAFEEYCKKDIEAVLNTLASTSFRDYLMRQGEDNEEDPAVLSDLEALTRDDGGVYPDGLDDPMAAIRSFCR